MKTPWMKWFPADWRADPKLRACSPLARYTWMEMLGLMHEAEPYGHLLLNGRPIQNETLSRLIGVEMRELAGCVRELDRQGVFSRTDVGVIYSRRMIRDRNAVEIAAKNGRRGGNPMLKNQGDSEPPDKGRHKGEDKAQMPDTRYQIHDMNPLVEEPREGARAAQPTLKLVAEAIAFPASGSIAYVEPWLSLSRKYSNGKDPDYVAGKFRPWCVGRGIAFDDPKISEIYVGFCKSDYPLKAG